MRSVWKRFLERHAFVIESALGVERAFAPAPIGPTATRCVDLNHMIAMQLAGPDAVAFLQGYLTCDLATLERSRALFGAYCNIKGRVVADATVALTHDHPTWVMHASLRETVIGGLSKYLAFSRSKFTSPDSAPILLGIVNPTQDEAIASNPFTVAPFRDGYAITVPGAHPRAMLLLPLQDAMAVWNEYAARDETADAKIWDLLDVLAGITHVSAATSEMFLPQMLDYDRLGAVSFTKGCYLGQEIVARAQHLGRPKRHLHTLSWRGRPAPSVGESLNQADGIRAGILVNVASTSEDRGEALAVLNDAVSAPLHIGEVEFAMR